MQGVIVTFQLDPVVAPTTSIRETFRRTAAHFSSLSDPRAQRALLGDCVIPESNPATIDEAKKLELLDFLMVERGVDVRCICREIKGPQGTRTFRRAFEFLLGKGETQQQAEAAVAS